MWSVKMLSKEIEKSDKTYIILGKVLYIVNNMLSLSFSV